MRRKLLSGFLLVLVAIQFIRPEKNVSAREQPDDLFTKYPAPQPVQLALRRSCYDCHSNNTHYPWYAQVQPVGWWLADHIKEGKENLNFSVFGTYSAKRAARKLDQSIEEIEDGTMPLPSYTWVHRTSILRPEDKKAVVQWLDNLRNQIQPEPQE
jgi:Haem-binding domain